MLRVLYTVTFLIEYLTLLVVGGRPTHAAYIDRHRRRRDAKRDKFKEINCGDTSNFGYVYQGIRRRVFHLYTGCCC